MKKAIKIAAYAFGAFVLIGIIAVATSDDKKPAPAVAAETAAPKMAFDIPDMFGEPIDTITARLGKPVSEFSPTDLQRTQGVPKEATFRKGTYELSVTFDPKSGWANGFALSDTADSFTDLQRVMIAGGLEANAASYTVTPIKRKDGKYASVRVE